MTQQTLPLIVSCRYMKDDKIFDLYTVTNWDDNATKYVYEFLPAVFCVTTRHDTDNINKRPQIRTDYDNSCVGVEFITGLSTRCYLGRPDRKIEEIEELLKIVPKQSILPF